MPKAAADKGSSGKKGSAGDADKPKRPLSAFILFSNAMRADVKKRNPDYKIGDIAKELGKQWSSMSDQQKAKYQNEASTLKAAYDRQTGKTSKK